MTAIDTYTAVPESGHGPGVLVLHETWGLTHDIRWAADRLAGLGYVAVAPDLEPFMRGVGGAMTQLAAGRGPLIEAALRSLDALEASPLVDGDGLGVAGFSIGGSLAMHCDRHPRVSVMSVNYAMVPRKAFSERVVPVVASFGGADRLLPRAGAALRRRLHRSGTQHDFLVYGGVGHSFMTPIGSRSLSNAGAMLGLRYRPLPANHAWDRVESFFARHLDPAVIDTPATLTRLRLAG